MLTWTCIVDVVHLSNTTAQLFLHWIQIHMKNGEGNSLISDSFSSYQNSNVLISRKCSSTLKAGFLNCFTAKNYCMGLATLVNASMQVKYKYKKQYKTKAKHVYVILWPLQYKLCDSLKRTVWGEVYTCMYLFHNMGFC